MKFKMLVASVALACSSLSYSQTTTEYSLSRTLPLINASGAYARGYTGKGSVIAILDTGIDTSNDEFKNKILAIKDFTNSKTIVDRVGHGTHVAGIAAAAKNGVGVQGVAYDASLIIGKITDNGVMNTSTVLTAANWAATLGADVANMSVTFPISRNTLTPVLIAPGIYKTSYTNTGKLPYEFDAKTWAAATKGEMVMVVAAGNEATAWSNSIAQLATATDANGNLLLGGRMIIAGNWNGVTNKTVGPSSDGAAHLCQVMVNSVCQDKYHTYDFFLMAPGTSIISTSPKNPINPTGLATMSGTSMAAPVISGGAAIIHQMWPQMTGANIVKLLLVTANKNLPNYSLYTMGQGLMDLDKATSPVGSVGIPTTGRLSGTTLASARPLVYTATGSASTGKLSGIMVVDSFERDFYINGKSFTAYKKSESFNHRQAMMVYESHNPYALFNSYNERANVKVGAYEMSIYHDTTNMLGTSPMMLELAYTKNFGDASIKFSGGFFNETNTWLGNSVGSFVGDGKNSNSNTQFVGVELNKSFDIGTNVYANFIHGVTQTSSQSENIQKIGSVLSYSWAAGIEQKLNIDNTIGVMAYQPVSVYRANADLVAPVGLDSSFNIIQNSSVNLAADVHELRTGIYHKFQNSKEFNTMTFVEARQNYHGQLGQSDVAFGFKFSKTF